MEVKKLFSMLSNVVVAPLVLAIISSWFISMLAHPVAVNLFGYRTWLPETKDVFLWSVFGTSFVILFVLWARVSYVYNVKGDS